MSSKEIERERVIVRTSVIGILANVVLVVFKALVGFAAGSIAIILDAVNNLTDVLSSVITIVGTKLANRAPDKGHPVGHGRMEYLTTMVVAVIILYAGVTAMIESVKKILHPSAASYSAVTFVVLVGAIVIKLALGTYVRRQGRNDGSGALEGSGLDALYDAIISSSVLATALLYMASGISLEAWMGVVIALLILRSGFSMIGAAVNAMMGARVSGSLSKAIKATVAEEPGVMGAYDLFLNDYGPGNYYGSVHVEVPETITAEEIDAMSHRIQERVLKKHGVVITTVGVYAYNTTNADSIEMRETVRKLVMVHKGVIQMHGFYASVHDKKIHFDVIISFNLKEREREALREHIVNDVQKRYPGWTVHTNLDIDMSD